MVDCVLVKPPRVEYTSKFNKLSNHLYGFHPPLGLLYIASMLEKEGISVSVIDSDIQGYCLEDCLEYIKQTSPSIVGITAMSTFVKTSAELLHRVKHYNKNILCVMGGPHPTVLPEETLKKYTGVDVIVRVEGEFTMLELCKAFFDGKDFSRIEGISYREDDKVLHTPNRPFIKDLGVLPFPARHLLPIEKYKINTIHGEHGITTSISTSRGCPYRCAFCGQHFGRKVRYFSPDYVMSEIHDILSLGINHIDFVDDTLTVNRKRLEAILDAIIKENLALQLAGTTRVDCIDGELLQKMRRAGFVRVDFGIESGNQGILDIIEKGITLDQARKAVRAAREAGLDVVTYFILGLPGDTHKTVEETINFACELNADVASFAVHLPLPGTKTWEMARNNEHGLTMLVDDIDGFGKHSEGAVIRVNDLSEQDLSKYYLKAYQRFYLRPSNIIKRFLCIIRSPRKLVNNVKAAAAYLFG